MSGAPTTPEGTLGTKCDGAPPLVETEVGRTDALTEGAAFIHRAHSQGGSPTFGRPGPSDTHPETGHKAYLEVNSRSMEHRPTGRKASPIRRIQIHRTEGKEGF